LPIARRVLAPVIVGGLTISLVAEPFARHGNHDTSVEKHYFDVALPFAMPLEHTHTDFPTESPVEQIETTATVATSGSLIGAENYIYKTYNLK